jgi:KaiC/GvpD/RAD55 family RecA-like ATPase
MMPYFVAIIIGVFGGGTITWFITLPYQRMKIKREADKIKVDIEMAKKNTEGIELDNAKKIVSLFKELSAHQQVEITELRKHVMECKVEIGILKPIVCYRVSCDQRVNRKEEFNETKKTVPSETQKKS